MSAPEGGPGWKDSRRVVGGLFFYMRAPLIHSPLGRGPDHPAAHSSGDPQENLPEEAGGKRV